MIDQVSVSTARRNGYLCHFLITVITMMLLAGGKVHATDSMSGCHSLAENGNPDMRFHVVNGEFRYTIRRRSGWQLQKDVFVMYHQNNKSPDLPSDTFDKIDTMLEADDLTFLILFKKDRIAEVKGHKGAEKAMEAFKKSNTPFLFGLDGNLWPAYPVPCPDRY